MIKWCFSTLGCTDRSLTDVLSLAKRYGITALEVRGIGGELDNGKIVDFLPQNKDATKNAFNDAGVLPLILGTSVSFHNEDAYHKNFSDAECALEIAERIGFSAIRVFGNSLVGDEGACIFRVASAIRELCIEADKKNISVFLEVHGDFNTAGRILPIVERCSDLKSFGLIWDICHTHLTYGKEWKNFYDLLAPYIRHVHVKDVKDGKHVLPGDGELPIVEIADYLISNGYDGYFSLEWEKYWRKELPDVEIALDKLFSLFK